MLTSRVTSSGHDPIWPRSHLIARLEPPSQLCSSPASITGLFTESRYDQSQRQIRLTLTLTGSILFSYPNIISSYPLPNDECTYKYFFRHLCCHSFIIGRHVPLYHVSVRHVSDEIDPITETESVQSDQPRPTLWAAILKSQYWHCIEPSLWLARSI